jgi:hypothetical protein
MAFFGDSLDFKILIVLCQYFFKETLKISVIISIREGAAIAS